MPQLTPDERRELQRLKSAAWERRNPWRLKVRLRKGKYFVKLKPREAKSGHRSTTRRK